MKTLTITLEDSMYTEIDERTTPDFDHSDVIQKLLERGLNSPRPGPNEAPPTTTQARPVSPDKDSIIGLIEKPEYRMLNGIDKYLAILSWLHKNRPDEFSKIGEYRKGNRIYFSKSQSKIHDSGASLTVKQIPDTLWWALATLDNKTKRTIIADILQILFNIPAGDLNRVVDTIADSGRHRGNIFADLLVADNKRNA